MANKNPFQQAAGLFGTQTTRTQVVTDTVASLTGVSGGDGGSSQTSALTDQLTSLTQQLQQLQSINQSQTEAMQANTQAVSQNTSAKGQGGGESAAGSVGNTLMDVFGLATGISPLISGLISLFGGGGSQPAAPTPYVNPLPVNATAGFSAASPGVFGVNTAAGGLPQPAPSATSATPSASPSITVQVQAMDSQSFLDHSRDIALAVRQAMLESSVLNDVIRSV